MKRFHYITIPLGVLAMLGCEKKTYPESIVHNDAVFYLQADVNGAPFKVEAGVNGYYMYSSFNRSSNDVYHFAGDLRRSDCGTCGESFKITFNHNQYTASGSLPDIASSLKAGKYPFATENTKQATVQFETSFNKEALSYMWDFGDGNSSSESAPLHTYRNAGKYNVCLTVNSTNNCMSQNCYELDFTENGYRPEVKAQNLGGNTIIFTAAAAGPTGGDSLTYQWDFGDGSRATGRTATHNYEVAGSYPVLLLASSVGGRSEVVRYNAVTSGDNSSCAANWRASSVTAAAWHGLGEIVINWKDKNGILYSSAKTQQTPDSYFEIEEIGDYEKNERGEATKKIKARFSCRVSDGEKVIELKNAAAVLAVSHP